MNADIKNQPCKKNNLQYLLNRRTRKNYGRNPYKGRYGKQIIYMIAKFGKMEIEICLLAHYIVLSGTVR
jgi:hypothetical protein